ncbi:MAG: hypothetical protein GAK38_01374 [Xylophilus sp.]|nr:MAG: hypothetical protein GAK38_01374 [Xylophilus sp.]
MPHPSLNSPRSRAPRGGSIAREGAQWARVIKNANLSLD